MIIKQPHMDNSLIYFLNSIQNIVSRIFDCYSWEKCFRCRFPDSNFAVLYFSSYNVQPDVLDLPHPQNHNITMRNLLNELQKVNPQKVICIIRLNAPASFPRNLRKIQQKAVDEFMKLNCYVKLYRKSQFINHAKFFFGFTYCPIQLWQPIYSEIYFGSTNMTLPGLSSHNRTGGLGNYEEFHRHKYRPRKYYPYYFPKESLYLLKEVEEIITERYNLYYDNEYLESYLNHHVYIIKQILNSLSSRIERENIGEIFQAYIDSQATYLNLLSFINDLPGRLRTESIIGELVSRVETPNPLEIEMLVPTNEEQAGRIADELGYKTQDLKERTKEYINVTFLALELLQKNYKVQDILEYFDRFEERFYFFLRENGPLHRERIRNFLRRYEVGF